MRLRPWLVAALCLATPALFAGQGDPITNDDVLKMVEAGFSVDTILEAIQSKETDFDTSLEALLVLKNAGVDEEIIRAMLAAARGEPGPSDEDGESDGLPVEVGVYVLKNGRYSPLEVEPVEWKASAFSSTSGGVRKNRFIARQHPHRSRVQLPSNPELLIVCAQGVSPVDYHLLRAEEERKRADYDEPRKFRVNVQVTEGGVFVALTGTKENVVRFDAEMLAARRFRLKLPILEEGEYAFLPPGSPMGGGSPLATRLYSFGVSGNPD